MLRFVLLLLMSTAAGAASLVPAPPTINADAYLLVDYTTGETLVAHNVDERLPSSESDQADDGLYTG